MRKYATLILMIFTSMVSCGQEIIELPFSPCDGVTWEGGEKEYFSELWQTQVVTNVSVPSMEVFRPQNPNGTAVIIAPGGALYAHSINSEGNDVAKWLNTKGITAFVLKYRLVPTGEDGIKDFNDDREDVYKKVDKIMPHSVNDGLAALEHVIKNANKYNVESGKIGFMGFSAGGAVTMGVTYNYSEKNRPDFIVPVYPWTTVMKKNEVPTDAPPMLVICATNDPLDLAEGSINLYSDWLKNKKKTGLHMYSQGGHGFGMRTQNLPSDNWISRFYEWALVEGFTTAE
ncbi:alpha/beta hydrolase [Maribacter sp. HTCC2170]|uniref:alpha/beta hydrolase n=1 Tax=Maribacter sp. (strain HTCC2170 / KCCM 42371) TaxID=313603 RepID=UPI00006B2166|nr:alpha/beta hydrolase [Maribacter sp. HTCC2170]EAR00159.1 putative xylanase [Maribacter sp. HTCC2170]